MIKYDDLVVKYDALVVVDTDARTDFEAEDSLIRTDFETADTNL